MKHHTRCLAALGLYAVSLLCLTDCHPAPADPVEHPSLTHSWEVSSTGSYQDALSSTPLSPEAELPLPETSPAVTETVFSSESTSTGSSLTETASPEASASDTIPTDSSQTSQTETAPPETSPPESSPTESTASEPVPPAPSAAPIEPPTSEQPTSESSTTDPSTTEAPTEPPTTESPPEPPTQAPAPSPTHDRSNGQLAFQRQNELLAQNGVTPLQWSEALYQIAAERAETISTEYSHAGCPDWVGENLLRGVISPDMAVQIWYDSDGHRQNMLAGWTYGAVANYGSYWAAVFAMTETP